MDLQDNSCGFSSHPNSDLNLETVRALHQTVVALRAALEQSRSELFELRVKVHSNSSNKIYADTIEKLALENHILRERMLTSKVRVKMEDVTQADDPSTLPAPSLQQISPVSVPEKEADIILSTEVINENQPTEADPQVLLDVTFTEESQDDSKVDIAGTAATFDRPEAGAGVNDEFLGKETFTVVNDGSSQADEVKMDQNVSTEVPNGIKQDTNQESDSDSEELDDIELIFTTEETKELGVLQEDLVSIDDSENWMAVNRQQSLPPTVEKSTQFDEENTGFRIPVNHSLIETDISKCGIIDENEIPTSIAFRRNTLPSPVPYRPIIHKEILSSCKSPSHAVKFSTSRSPRLNGSSDTKRVPMRPILVESNGSVKKESEAQTDITALPPHWKSESYLAHKVSHQFTTLPSKFTLPTRQVIQSRPSLKICDRNQDARRILLSDINFTSMVPELSRSADHLALESGVAGSGEPSLISPNVSGLYRNFPRAFSYMKNPDVMGSYTVASGYQHTRECGRFQWSPCECITQGRWEFPPRYQSSHSSTTSPQPHEVDMRHRPEMKPSASSLDVCRHGYLIHKPTSSSTWQSEPASPTHCSHHSQTRSVPLTSAFAQARSKYAGPAVSCGSRHPSSLNQVTHFSRSRSKVSFQGSGLRRQGRGGQSLPDLRITDVHGDSGDSTDSLVDEAEDYVRRSIDSIITRTGVSNVNRRRFVRRHSDPDPVREFVAPKSAQPYLPKVVGDLKLDHLVKVITADGRVTVGRVRYLGAVAGLSDPHVGVELPSCGGDSDGSFRGRRYFECDQSHSLFVPFKKVVMAWKA